MLVTRGHKILPGTEGKEDDKPTKVKDSHLKDGDLKKFESWKEKTKLF